jgi:putative hydrolase of the HAD superfamily
MSTVQFNALFLDIGGVLLTNGWDRHSREGAAKKFNLDFTEMSERHSLAFDTYEIGHMTLDEYLNYVVFYQSRDFSPEQFKDFMFSQSQPYLEMISLIKNLKAQHSLKIVAVSNEGRELVKYRIKTYELDDLFDVFVFSGFIHLRKPDPEFYQMAIDLSQVKPENVIYIDDRPLLVEMGRKLGFWSICHSNVAATRSLLNELLKSK